MITVTTSLADLIGRPCSAAALAALLSNLIFVPSASGQEPGIVTVDVAACFELEREPDRQTCFAASVNDALAATESGDGSASAHRDEPVVDALSGDSSPTTARNRASQSQPAATRPELADPEQSAATGEEYYGTVVAIRERLPSSYVITLDNGQVWQQTEPKRYPLRPGLEVRIYPTRWGDRYRLSGLDTGGHIQVQRIR